jgi:hypothetical protein
MITILAGLEVEVEISTFGVGGEEGGVLLGGHIEVLMDLSTLSKFQFQHPLFRSIADAGDTAGIYRNSSHDFLDADGPRKNRGRKLLPSSPRAAATDEVDETVRDADQRLSQVVFRITQAASPAMPEDHENRVTPISKALAQPQDGHRRGPAFRHRREPLPA